MAVNATSVFLGTTRRRPRWRRPAAALMVNISSIMGFIGGADSHPGYSASKGAVRIFTKSGGRAVRTDGRARQLCASGLPAADAERYECRRARRQDRR